MGEGGVMRERFVTNVLCERKRDEMGGFETVVAWRGVDVMRRVALKS